MYSLPTQLSKMGAMAAAASQNNTLQKLLRCKKKKKLQHSPRGPADIVVNSDLTGDWFKREE